MAFSLDVPKREEIVNDVVESTAVDIGTVHEISKMTEEKGNEILDADISNFNERKALTTAIETFGADVVRQSAKKNELMKTRIGDLSKAGSEGGAVAKGLEELTVKMQDLDPSGIDFMKKGILGKLFNPARAYFNKYKQADEAISQIIASLDEGSRILTDDNTTLEIEQAAMRDLTKQLNEKIMIGEELDKYLTGKVQEQRAANEDLEKVKFVEEEIIFPLRQRMIDFNQVLVVNQNGIIAMEVVRKNNLELIRSVSRAKTVTVSALNVAVTVAAALYNQKIMLEKVKALNETTNQMISATSKMLKEQGAEIQKQASESNLDVETLKNSFKETLEALDAISNYKQEALPQMKTMIHDFRILASEGESAIQRIEAASGK